MKHSTVVAVLLAVFAVYQTEGSLFRSRRASLSAFDSLGGMGLGKRSFWLVNNDFGTEKRARWSAFDTLGGIGLGKRSGDEDVKRALSSFDTLGGIGLGKRSSPFIDEKRTISAFDSLGGIGLGKRNA